MAFKKFRNMKVYEQSGYNYKSTPKVISSFELADAKRDASIFKAQTGMKMYKVK